MNRIFPTHWRRFAIAFNAAIMAVAAHAATRGAPNDPPDLSGTPPDLARSVDPNILVTFDDSGSMGDINMGDQRPFDNGNWGFAAIGDNPWLCAGVIDPRAPASDVRAKAMNGIYYNPNVIYSPPLKADGSSFPQADATLSAVWADGYNFNRPRNPVTPDLPAYLNSPTIVGNTDNRVAIINGRLEQVGALLVDRRWNCSYAAGVTVGPNPVHPTAYSDGSDITAGSPYYFRLKSSVSLPVDANGNLTSAAVSTLYTSSNWEAVRVTNTDVVIGNRTINQWQNFANWYAYYRTRNLMTRTALTRTFGILDSNIRVAWQNINALNFQLPTNAIITELADTGTCSAADVDPATEQVNQQTACYRSAFFNWIYTVAPGGETPNRLATLRAGNFFKRNSRDLRDPYFDAGTGADLGCRQNFHMLVTDGYWNESDPRLPSGFFTAASGPPGGTLPDGTPYSQDTPTQIYWDTQDPQYPSSLANIAFYYWATDLRPDLAPTGTPVPFHDPVPPFIKDNTTGVTTPPGASSDAQREEVYFNPVNDPATWRHVVQFMVTLGVSGNLNFSTDVDCSNPAGNDLCALRRGTTTSLGSVGWPAPVNNAPPAIDDTWHAAINSRGSYFNASNPASLVSHLTDVINSITARAGHSAAESVSSSILTENSASYQGGYNSSGWAGYLYKQKLDPTTGAVTGAPLWDAGCFLTGGLCTATSINVGAAIAPAARIIITAAGNTSGSLSGVPFQWSSLDANEKAALNLDPTTTHPDTSTDLVPPSNGFSDDNGVYRLDYLRGVRTYETTPTPGTSPTSFRARTSVLGAIIRSQAVYEGAPSGGHRDIYPLDSPEQTAAASGNSYEHFVNDHLAQPPVVYVGANDGMLHAFDAGTGAEKWAYVPHTLFGNGQLDQLTNPANGLVSTVDDTPIIQDVFVANQWKTMLVGSLRLGGRGIYALDITDASTPVSESVAAGKFMWEFTSEQDPDLDYTYASANIARLRCNVAPCRGTGSPGGTWVVIVSSGYAPRTLPGQVNGNSAINAAPGVSRTQSYLWVLNAVDGSVIAKLATKTGVTSYGLSTPDVVDFGLDQIDDIAVAGDLAGNLWRFDLSDADPSNWSSQVDNLFRSYTSDSPCSRHNPHGVGCEPISVMPVAFADADTGSVIYVFGSGQYLGASDRTAADVLTPQHFFGVADLGTHASVYPITENSLATHTLTEDAAGNRYLDYTPQPPANHGTTRGWQIPLDIASTAGERDVTTVTPIFSTGTALLPSLIPASDNDPCTPGASGALIAVDATTGGPVASSSGGAQANVQTTAKVGKHTADAPPTLDPLAALAQPGGGSVLIAGTQPTQFEGVTPIWRRTSWRELLNNL